MYFGFNTIKREEGGEVNRFEKLDVYLYQLEKKNRLLLVRLLQRKKSQIPVESKDDICIMHRL